MASPANARNAPVNGAYHNNSVDGTHRTHGANTTYDGDTAFVPYEETYTSSVKDQTGLLTRWVPEKIKHSSIYRWLLRLSRLLQSISSIVSLGLFSARMRKIYKLVNALKTSRGVNGTIGAVEGILAAAVLYTLIAMLVGALLKSGGPKWLRWLWVILDLVFVGAFIAVAVLTGPNSSMANPFYCYDTNNPTDVQVLSNNVDNSKDDICNLPWGTFILAIFSTLFHAITAAFHEVRDSRKSRKETYVKETPRVVSQDEGFPRDGMY